MIGLEKKYFSTENFFLIGLLLSCFAFSNTALDFTLTPRLFFLSIFIFSFFLYLVLANKELRIKIDAITLLFLIYALLSVLSVSWAQNKSLSIIEASKTLLFFSFFSIARYVLNARNKALYIKLLKVILFLFFLSLLPLIIQAIDLPGYSRLATYNISAISGHKNLYSSFVFLCLIYSLIGFFNTQGKWKMVFGVSSIAQFIIIIILQTRTVWLAVTVSVLVLIILHLTKNKSRHILNEFGRKHVIGFILFSLLVLNVFFLYAFPKIVDVLLKEMPKSESVENIYDTSTLTERFLIWDKTFEISKENPILGVGGNNWQIAFPSKSLPDIYRVLSLDVTFQRPHNDFLWILTEYGILGLNIYFSLILCVLALLFWQLIVSEIRDYRILFAGLIGFLCIAFFDFPRERIEHNILFYLMLAISLALFENENISAINGRVFRIKRGVLLLFAALFGMIIICTSLNFRGECYTKRLYSARANKSYSMVISNGSKALSFCYTIDPTSIPISWYRGNAYASTEKYQKALDDFRQAFKDHPFNHHVLNDYASSLVMNGMVDSAKILYKEAARINPRFPEPRLNLTALYINEGNYLEAEKWNESIVVGSKRKTYYRMIIEQSKVNVE